MELTNSSINLMDPRHKTVSIIADTGIVCLDYLLDMSMLRYAKDIRFAKYSKVQEASLTSTTTKNQLHPVEPQNEAPDSAQLTLEEQIYRSQLDSSFGNISGDNTYKVTVKQALEIFDREWLPVPYYRNTTHSGEFVNGPTNWARIYLAAPKTAEDKYHVVLAFDSEHCKKSDGRPYAGPDKKEDSQLAFSFRLTPNIGTQCEYATGSWQKDWIAKIYTDTKNRTLPVPQPGRPPSQYKLKDPGEPWAYYVTLLQALPTLVSLPAIKLIKAFEPKETETPDKRVINENFVDVDLVLDIGNSRTCGLLAEFGPGRDRVGLGAQPPTLLRMRELTRPERVSVEPFESRIEFNPAKFGSSLYGRGSGRPSGKDAFWWPSPLRVGVEAAWLANQSTGRAGTSGMSSPKRYVWDDARRVRPWINNEASVQPDGTIPRIAGPISERLTEDGRVRYSKNDIFGPKTAYSRGSLYMLMIAEILSHAIAQINSPVYRYDKSNTDLPRRLRTIIITLPSATPLAERKKMRAHATRAIDLVWNAYSWNGNDLLHPKPRVIFDWDEATCTQMVFLYNELEHRFQEFPKAFFELFGRGRKGKFGPALRIASLDIGGGTTDLMIIDHELDDQLIHPKQLFREGQRVAGDDILKNIIQRIVLPTYISALTAYGVTNADCTINFLFGGDTANITPEEQVQRALFVSRVFIPVAVRLLDEYERSGKNIIESYAEFAVGDVVERESVTAPVIDYLAKAVSMPDRDGFDPLAVRITMRPREMAGSAQAVIGSVIRDFCDVVRAYDCDILITSGRPTAMPAIRDIILGGVPLTADRIVSMYGYEVGNWYPYRSQDSRIWDPKTTAAVGAMICHLCSGDYASFSIETSSLKPKSTARFIGRMNTKGQISKDDVIFENLAEGERAFKEFEARISTTLDIGYRQLPYERWVTSQLYCCQFKNPDIARELEGRRPLRLKLKRVEGDNEPDRAARLDENELVEYSKEDFEIVEAYDRNNNPVDAEDMLTKLQLRTYFGTVDQVEAGYWIDSGVLDTKDLIDREKA